MRLQDQVAIVTGAAQGLGEALARRLASEGCQVVLTDIHEEAVRTTAARIAEESGRRAIGVRADVTRDDDCAYMVEHTMAAFGKVDILVANAGILKAGDILEFSPADWRRVIDVNLVGYFLCAQAVARVMIPRRAGSIVQINSKSGKKGSFRNSAYAASKFGGIGLTQSIALDLAPHNIRVNAVCPGNLLDGTLWQDSLFEQYARTQGLTREQVRAKYEGQVPLGRGATYEDVAGVVVFLCSSDAAYMTGQAINVTGGQEMR
ncbi:MAG: sorbitol-6-phosphate dehydrogenase [Capsulimonadales bacterium]|nr:sorbitol-6-phosphate dehydrogenase [Capsulimonadales bacterium]